MPTPRQIALAHIATLDTPTVLRLDALSDKIIVPDQDALIRVNFEDMISLAHDLADVYFPAWTDRTKADFGEFMVELFALFSWKDFYYMNVFHKESFLRRSNTYSFMALHAIRNGYRPRQLTSSSVNCNISFTGVPAPVVYEIGSLEVIHTDTGIVFTNAEEISVNAGDSTVSVLMSSGVWRTDSGAFNGKSIRVGTNNCVPYSVSLQVGNDTWTQVNSFAEYGASAKVFMVLPSDGLDVELIFGLSGYGARPALDASYTVGYRVDNKQPTNVVQGVITISKNTPGGYATGATMNSAAIGGALPESIESIRENGSMMYRVFGTENIVTPQDAITLLEAHPLVYRATAFAFANTLYYTVILKSGVAATVLAITNISDALNFPAIKVCYDLAPSETSFVTINSINATGYIYNEFDEVDIENQIRDFMSFITDPLQGAQYGQSFDVGFIAQQLIEKIAGLHQFVFYSVNGATPAENIVLGPLQIFNAISQGNFTLTIIKTS